MIQDTTTAKRLSVPFGNLRYDEKREVIHDKDDKELIVNEDRFLELFISELMTLQLETFSSQFGCGTLENDGKKELKIVKHFDFDPENSR